MLHSDLVRAYTASVPESDQALRLTREALAQCEDPQFSVATLVRKAQRIAAMRHDVAAQVRLCQQTQQRVDNTPDPEVKAKLGELRNQLITLLGEERGKAEFTRQVERFFASRRLDSAGNVSVASIDALESNLVQIERAYNGYVVPASVSGSEAFVLSRDMDAARAKLIDPIAQMKSQIARVRQSVHDYLVETEVELDAGQAESSFFDAVQVRINGLLQTYAPEAAANFVAAQERITGGTQEDISHALTSCRRMIKSLADRLYPPTGEEVAGLDGVPRKMSDELYRNRLVQYVREQVGKHKNGEVLQAVLTDLGKRLNSLDGLASKGVHADPSIDEARTCIAQTYFLAGDILSIAEGTSPHMQD